MRVFAGPNGSGKSTIIKEIQKQIYTGVYINADDIEKIGTDKGFVNIGDFGVTGTVDNFNEYLGKSTLLGKANAEQKPIRLSFADNIIRIEQDTHSYEAALIAEYLRNLLIESGITFSFETVMSHPSKLQTLEQAREAGYKNYLYFIGTESPEINIQRVASRVKKKGHPVDEQKIIERYPRSMELLSSMIPLTDRCFIFDNSKADAGFELILEIENGSKIVSHTDGIIPNWIDKYVLKKMGV